MIFKNFFWIFLFLLASISVFGQNILQDSIIVIDEVVIQSDRLKNYAIGVALQELDSSKIDIYKSQSLSSLLANESGVSIKSYGISGLATPSIRGGGSSQAALLWNDINLQSSMNGQASLSLIPVQFFDNVEVQYGGGSSLFGSGVLSGAIHLDNGDLFKVKDYASIQLGLGSYGEKVGALKVKKQFGKVHSNLNVFYRTADNDFEFTNESKFGQPKETQTNAGFTTAGLTQTNEIVLTDHATFKTSLWMNHNDKGIQSLMIQDTSDATQEDNSIRVLLNYHNDKNNNPLNIKSAYLYDELRYTNPDLADPTSNSFTHSFINEIEKSIQFNQKNELYAGLNYTMEQAFSEGLTGGDVVRNRISLFSSYRVKNIMNRANLAFNARQEMVDSKFIPTVFSAGFDYQVTPNLILNGTASKNYRIPTFNDLYWRTDTYSSGNPNLQPESGYNLDFGIKEFLTKNNVSATFSQEIYWTRTNNWILWLPNENGVWTPENKQTGKSYGAEISYRVDIEFTKFRLFSDGFFKYSISEQKDNDIEDEWQSIWYEPKYSFSGNIGVVYKRFSATYNHNYYSKRYYDNTSTLDPYYLAAFYFNYRQPINDDILALSFNLNNVWDTNYQTVAWYAMPPTNYQLSLTYHFNI